MKPSRLRFAVAAGCLMLLGTGSDVLAQADRCMEVLRNGTLQNFDLSQTAYFQQVLATRFSSMTYEESKKERAAGLDIPIGEKVMGSANYSDSQFRKKQSQIRNQLDLSTTSSSALDVAVTRGDPTIIAAWSKCIDQSDVGGLELRFLVRSPTEATATLNWKAGKSTVYETKLLEDVLLPDRVRVRANASCLKAGRVLRHNRPCTAILKLPSATETIFTMATSTEGESNQAYLPARMRVREETRSYDFGADCQNKIQNPGHYRENSPEITAYQARCPNRLYTWAHRTLKTPSITVTLSPEEIADGWTFQEGTANVALQVFLNHNRGSCRDLDARIVTPHTFTYGFTIDHGARDNGARVCAVEPSVTLIRHIWEPDEPKPSKP